MVQTDTTQQQTETQPIAPTLAGALPRASEYMLQLLEYKNNGRTEQDLIDLVNEYKKDLQIPQDLNADDLVIQIILLRQSAAAAKRKIEVLKSQKALAEIASVLTLDAEFLNLLLNHYASVSCEKLFVNEYENLSDSLNPQAEKPTPEFSKIIDKLIDDAQKKETSFAAVREENKEYLAALLKDKKISYSLYLDLCETYCFCGAASFQPLFEDLLKALGAQNDNPSLNSALACKVLLYEITKEDALEITKLDKVMPYRLLEDDLQTIAFKYLKLKSPQDAADTLEAVLKRLSCADNPVENLGLAVRVVTDARVETLQEAEAIAAEKRGKILFMRKLAGYKFFSGCEDELTSTFYGHYSIEEVLSLFSQVLRELPYNNDINENADIGLKVLLKKLPLKDAVSQALFRKENKSNYSADALENEALNNYLGTKSREDALSILREKLHPYSFWKDDGAKHCYALSVALEELNGNISSSWADTVLTLLEKGYPDESIDIIAEGLSSQKDITADTIISAYDKFYASGKNHKDAAMRVVNMLQ